MREKLSSVDALRPTQLSSSSADDAARGGAGDGARPSTSGCAREGEGGASCGVELVSSLMNSGLLMSSPAESPAESAHDSARLAAGESPRAKPQLVPQHAQEGARRSTVGGAAEWSKGLPVEEKQRQVVLLTPHQHPVEQNLGGMGALAEAPIKFPYTPCSNAPKASPASVISGAVGGFFSPLEASPAPPVALALTPFDGSHDDAGTPPPGTTTVSARTVEAPKLSSQGWAEDVKDMAQSPKEGFSFPWLPGHAAAVPAQEHAQCSDPSSPQAPLPWAFAVGEGSKKEDALKVAQRLDDSRGKENSGPCQEESPAFTLARRWSPAQSRTGGSARLVDCLSVVDHTSPRQPKSWGLTPIKARPALTPEQSPTGLLVRDHGATAEGGASPLQGGSPSGMISALLQRRLQQARGLSRHAVPDCCTPSHTSAVPEAPQSSPGVEFSFPLSLTTPSKRPLQDQEDLDEHAHKEPCTAERARSRGPRLLPTTSLPTSASKGTPLRSMSPSVPVLHLPESPSTSPPNSPSPTHRLSPGPREHRALRSDLGPPSPGAAGSTFSEFGVPHIGRSPSFQALPVLDAPAASFAVPRARLPRRQGLGLDRPSAMALEPLEEDGAAARNERAGDGELQRWGGMGLGSERPSLGARRGVALHVAYAQDEAQALLNALGGAAEDEGELPSPMTPCSPNRLGPGHWPPDCPEAPDWRRKEMARSSSLKDTKLLLTTQLKRSQSIFLFDRHFEFLREIGRGSFSKVYEARDRRHGTLCAVKVSRREFRSKAERERYLHEVESVAGLEEHPNIVKYYRGWQQDSHFYIQMELCEGGSLRHLLEASSELLPEDKVWEYCVQLAQGLQHIHNAGVLHLDIKPENILIDLQGMLKIGDFGQAVMDQRWAWEDGDGGYLAPELLNATPPPAAESQAAETQSEFVPTPGCDMFSFGAVLYELATLQRLPRGRLRSAALACREGLAAAGRTEELCSLIARLLEADPALRPSADEVLTWKSQGNMHNCSNVKKVDH